MSFDAWLTLAVVVVMLLALVREAAPPAALVLTATVTLLIAGVIDEPSLLRLQQLGAADGRRPVRPGPGGRQDRPDGTARCEAARQRRQGRAADPGADDAADRGGLGVHQQHAAGGDADPRGQRLVRAAQRLPLAAAAAAVLRGDSRWHDHRDRHLHQPRRLRPARRDRRRRARRLRGDAGRRRGRDRRPGDPRVRGAVAAARTPQRRPNPLRRGARVRDRDGSRAGRQARWQVGVDEPGRATSRGSSWSRSSRWGAGSAARCRRAPSWPAPTGSPSSRRPTWSSTCSGSLGSARPRTSTCSPSTARHGLIEAVVSIRSPLIGKTIRDADFRATYGAAVIAVHRGGSRAAAENG